MNPIRITLRETSFHPYHGQSLPEESLLGEFIQFNPLVLVLILAMGSTPDRNHFIYLMKNLYLCANPVARTWCCPSKIYFYHCAKSMFVKLLFGKQFKLILYWILTYYRNFIEILGPLAPVIQEFRPIPYGLNISWQSDVNSVQDEYQVTYIRNDTSEKVTRKTTDTNMVITDLYPGAGYVTFQKTHFHFHLTVFDLFFKFKLPI